MPNWEIIILFVCVREGEAYVWYDFQYKKNVLSGFT